ncbi:RNA-directed DNA polymerase, eukaryota, reverse transcriptase zinc-binding domain protein [Tanacetum coccineum]
MASCEINYHCDKCALFFKKVDQYLKHVNDVHESVQHHDSFNYHDFVVAIVYNNNIPQSRTKTVESECTPSKLKEEDLFELEMTEEMIEVDQAIRFPKSPDWSPRVTFLDYSTDVFVLAPSLPSSN